MPNIQLIKEDNRITSIPVGSILAIITTALDGTRESEPNRKSILMTDFRLLDAVYLNHTTAEVNELLEEQKKPKKRKAMVIGTPKMREWMRLEAGGDFNFFLPDHVVSWEQVLVGDEERIKVWWQPPVKNAGTGANIPPTGYFVDNSEANINILTAHSDAKE